jgi:hypothetical protein
MNYHLLHHSVVLNYDGKTISIAREDDRFNEIIQCIKEDRLNDIPDIVDKMENMFKKYDNVKMVDGTVVVNGTSLPAELSSKIITYSKEGLQFDSLLKFWENLKLNPSYNARLMLFAFLEHNGHPITNDGYFIAYRGCTNDFKDRYSGKFDNQVGSICEMNRSEVDDNPNNTCSSGLHVACYDYTYNWAGNGYTVEVKVNPMDVVCVPTDYHNTKMRVCKFEVVGIAKGERTDTVYEEDQEEYDDEEYFEDTEDQECEEAPDGDCDACGACGDECPF